MLKTRAANRPQQKTARGEGSQQHGMFELCLTGSGCRACDLLGGDAIAACDYRCRRWQLVGSSCSVPTKHRSRGTVVHKACRVFPASSLLSLEIQPLSLFCCTHTATRRNREGRKTQKEKRRSITLTLEKSPINGVHSRAKSGEGRAACSREAAISDVNVPIRMHLQSPD